MVVEIYFGHQPRRARNFALSPDFFNMISFHWNFSGAKAAHELGLKFHSFHEGMKDLGGISGHGLESQIKVCCNYSVINLNIDQVFQPGPFYLLSTLCSRLLGDNERHDQIDDRYAAEAREERQ